ncbi:hypothetical protein M3A96_01650 [Helcobacillus massiliensis]|uniref:Uncharacterized protein n=1 Tax=Helcobacillus massiliensis TaxID=521392 RepID=A0A839R317_9MICO|nr:MULTISPECIES: hypothetical protein [Helcobacillus]MBB3023696.1 hypothetical protein [Helcobacillus massiliensis]MCG7427216.1 hypothetical protein [Helcobacillus sp. ACRRO]MCT1556831.1 hypothetical protein [Helcobacillus massiliensis]MCT2035655.1 hypothetical protein [Helcobacillus massiliensis]MCT2330893.1 hypothetical protein [Helcobacillus massiliensis]
MNASSSRPASTSPASKPARAVPSASCLNQLRTIAGGVLAMAVTYGIGALVGVAV